MSIWTIAIAYTICLHSLNRVCVYVLLLANIIYLPPRLPNYSIFVVVDHPKKCRPADLFIFYFCQKLLSSFTVNIIIQEFELIHFATALTFVRFTKLACAVDDICLLSRDQVH